METENVQNKEIYLVVVEGDKFPRGSKVYGEYDGYVPEAVQTNLIGDVERGYIDGYTISKVIKCCRLEPKVKSTYYYSEG